MNAQYDNVADFYGQFFSDLTMTGYTAVEQLIMPYIPNSSVILDLCCGDGQVASILSEKGYNVYGIDISEKMIEKAKLNAPKASFKVGDASDFTYDISFDAVISTLDSINHITNRNDVEAVFKNIGKVLKEGGLFYFDIRNEDGYKCLFDKQCFSVIEKEQVLTYQSFYNEKDKIGIMKGVYFQYKDTWKREDFCVIQRCYLEEELSMILRNSGFEAIEVIKGKQNLDSNILGRTYFKCRKAHVATMED